MTTPVTASSRRVTHLHLQLQGEMEFGKSELSFLHVPYATSLKPVTRKELMRSGKPRIGPEFDSDKVMLSTPLDGPVHQDSTGSRSPHPRREVESAECHYSHLGINRLSRMGPNNNAVLGKHDKLPTTLPVGSLHVKQVTIVSLYVRLVSILTVDLVNQANQPGTIFRPARAKNPIFLHLSMADQITELFKSQLLSVFLFLNSGHLNYRAGCWNLKTSPTVLFPPSQAPS